MLLWEMSVLCEDRKGKGELMGWNNPPLEWGTTMTKPLWYWRSRTHHEIAADAAIVFDFFPGPFQSLKAMKQHRDGVHRDQPGMVCDLHQVLEAIPTRPAQLRSATFSRGKKANKSSLCIYTPVWGWTTAWCSQWVAHPWALCISEKAQGALDQRPFFSCVHARCVVLHQLAHAHSCRAFLGESKLAFKVSAHFTAHSKTRWHYCSSYQSPGSMSTKQHDLAFKQEPSD